MQFTSRVTLKPNGGTIPDATKYLKRKLETNARFVRLFSFRDLHRFSEEVAPIRKSRESEFPPTEKLNVSILSG